ncbi:hypothetical protein Dimus_007295 [Dionaea muscipula]
MDELSSGISIFNGIHGGSCEFNEQDSNSCVSEEDVVQKAVATSDAALQVEDVQPLTDMDPPSDEDYHANLEDKNTAGNHSVDLDYSAAGNLRKCMSKCATFPKPHYPSSKLEDGDERTPDSQLRGNISYSRSLSLPTPRTLVSALKGSREKEGAPPRKLSVSWAPDVYDPPPTSLSHSPKKKSQQQFKNNKKHEEALSKDGGGRSERCLDSDRMAATARNCNASVQFGGATDDEDNTDSSCASSFLRKSRGTMHVAYAEAM